MVEKAEIPDNSLIYRKPDGDCRNLQNLKI